MTVVVTGWTGRDYNVLGEQFVRSFNRYWPDTVKLVAVVDEPARFAGRYLDRMITISVADLHGLTSFQNRHADAPNSNGRVERKSWSAKDRASGYSFRTDAVKFAPQLFMPEAASVYVQDDEVLAWF